MTESPKLLDLVRARLRLKHYSLRTEQSYVAWIRRFILFHGKRHSDEMGTAEVEQFLSHLATSRRVASSTQNQALAALLFLYREVLSVSLPWLDEVTRAKKPKRLPVVLTAAEVRTVLNRMSGAFGLMAQLLYGSGMRVLECARLRVKDIDFARNEILIRDGKGSKDRVTVLPQNTVPALRRQFARVKVLHDDDLARGLGEVFLPFALSRKYPGAGRQWAWQYVFLQAGYDIRTVQELLGHKDVSTTMIYKHVLNRGGRGVRSPLDA